MNHNGNITKAKRLVKEAFKAGADIIKFQTFSSDRLTTKTARAAKYQKNNTGIKINQYNLIKDLELTKEMHKKIKLYADKIGIEFCSTAFDVQSLKFLLSLGIKRIKNSLWGNY